MAPTNLSILTHSHRIASLKKRAKREQVKEIVFDDDARAEFLTGFRKRKLAKKEAVKKKAMEREKQERREQRLEHRRALAEQARSNAKEVETAYGAIIDEDEDKWNGVGSGASDKDKEREEEYSDEEQVAHVTVVEEFDPTDIHGTRHSHSDAGDENVDEAESPSRPQESRAPPWSSTSAKKKDKKDAKKIKYQTAAARKAEERKQKNRKAEKADRARGKSKDRKRKRADYLSFHFHLVVQENGMDVIALSRRN
ncbi:hypothetical protein NEOLEDRAFT_934923 [Neolentinus lepideus HHB14362 ss-1]|uniref:Uncharacterized protein n=1 Tax=Neolentinus lepideus HHB14362 ss-1 TaxID=1314782 RepID=A0A165NIC3_9AGAM|nr:hypothetical protein NEOLEDRAFT_934923 [Neolentinus lepideus HHB14362 ss-1]